jgi:hypothetical protein
MWVVVIVLMLLLYGKYDSLWAPMALLVVVALLFHVRNLYRRRYM